MVSKSKLAINHRDLEEDQIYERLAFKGNEVKMKS